MITEHGFCTECRHSIHQHPDLACPWCDSHQPDLGLLALGLDADAPPAERFKYAGDAIWHLGIQRIRLLEVQRQAAREILAAPDVPAAARGTGTNVARIEKMAQPPPEPACHRGHLRFDHGYKKTPRGRWRCRVCDEDYPRAKEPEVVPLTGVRRRQQMRDQWKAHERRLAARRDAIARGEVPDSVAPPLPPPGAGKRTG